MKTKFLDKLCTFFFILGFFYSSHTYALTSNDCINLILPNQIETRELAQKLANHIDNLIKLNIFSENDVKPDNLEAPDPLFQEKARLIMRFLSHLESIQKKSGFEFNQDDQDKIDEIKNESPPLAKRLEDPSFKRKFRHVLISPISMSKVVKNAMELAVDLSDYIGAKLEANLNTQLRKGVSTEKIEETKRKIADNIQTLDLELKVYEDLSKEFIRLDEKKYVEPLLKLPEFLRGLSVVACMVYIQEGRESIFKAILNPNHETKNELIAFQKFIDDLKKSKETWIDVFEMAREILEKRSQCNDSKESKVIKSALGYFDVLDMTVSETIR